MVKYYIVLIALCLSVAQCTGRFSQSSKSISLKPLSFSDIEARHSDIPIPLKYKPARKGLSESVLIFDIDQSIADITQFYTLEMERMGWHSTDQFTGDDESLFVFKKSYKSCSISLRALKVGKKPKTHVVIMINQQVK